MAKARAKSRASRATAIPDRAQALQLLDEYWEDVLQNETLESSPEIEALINSGLLAIRYCLPTQLLGKLTDGGLDALCLQAGDKEAGQWDPRSFCKAVVAPWVLRNQKVLGGSGDPYVGNPLRRPRLDEGLDQMSDVEEWDALCDVLRVVQSRSDPGYTAEVFKRTLAAIRNRMREQDFVYVIPPRISLAQAEGLVDSFLSKKSGGDRGLAVVAALFETFKEKLGIYKEVRRGVINAADAATGSAADLECAGENGEIILAVEVKERSIGDDDVQLAVSKARAFDVRELLFCTEGIVPEQQAAVRQTFKRAWDSGTSLYHTTVGGLMHDALPLLGQAGILEFVTQVGCQLDRFSTQPKHRRAWKDLLDAL